MVTNTTNAASSITIGLVQMACSDSPATNLDRAMSSIIEASSKGAQIVCLQELFRSTYPCQSENVDNFANAESIPGPTTTALCQLAASAGIVIIAPLFERRSAGVFHNTAVVIDADGSIVGRYRKMHIPDDPLYYEKFYFTPGDLGFQAVSTRFGPIGILLCWDQWFPEAARLTAMAGAQIIFCPTAIGYHPQDNPGEHRIQRESWQVIQRSHAIANGVYLAAVNRTGLEGQLRFWGTSFVTDPSGSIIDEASETQEGTLIVSCLLDKIESTRQNWPFFRDRRIDAYDELTRRLLD